MHDNFKDNNGDSVDKSSEYVKYEDYDVDRDVRDDDDVDGDDDINFKVDNSNDDNSQVSKLDKIVQCKRLLEEISSIQVS